MFDLLKEFMTFKLLKFKGNEIYLGDERLVLYYIPQLAWEQIFNYRLHDIDYLAARYLGAKVRVVTFLQSYRGTLIKSINDAATLCQKIMNGFGFGKFSIEKVNEETHFMLVHVNSTLADEIKMRFGPQKIPMDFMYAGLFAGATEYYCKERIYCIETRCIAQKNVNSCEFVASNKEKISKFLSEYAPDKIEWAEKVMSKIDEIENKLLPKGIESLLIKKEKE